ncbi:MAG: hypothetical protein AAF289_00060 [Cyanobacteria bacterium P01_A01_bin.135]
MPNPNSFRPVFGAVLCLTLATGGISLHLSSSDDLNPYQERIFETSTTACQVGLLTVFGLLGGKATGPGRSKSDDV